MSKFKIGDRVRMSEEYKLNNPRDTYNDAKAVIVEKSDWKVRDEDAWTIRYEDGVEGLVYDSEIELVDPMIGRRVRCTNTSRFNGTQGTIVGRDGRYFLIDWDGHIPGKGTNGGSWSTAGFIFIDEQSEEEDSEVERLLELIERKDRALEVAAFAFGFYAKNHLDKKLPESDMKAITNIGLERIMRDAIEAD